MTKRWGATLLGLILLALFSPQAGFAQSSEELKALRKEIEGLKEGQKSMQKDLQEIKNLLRAKPAAPSPQPQNVVLQVEGHPFKGEKTAKLTLIEFSDFQ